MSGRIKYVIEVDDERLNRAIGKMEHLKLSWREVAGRGTSRGLYGDADLQWQLTAINEINVGLDKLEESQAYYRIGYMNRATRTLLSQFPGMSEYLSTIYRFRSILATIQKGMPEIGVALFVVTVMKWLIEMRKEIEQLNERQERLIRDVTGMSYREYDAWARIQQQKYRSVVPW